MREEMNDRLLFSPSHFSLFWSSTGKDILLFGSPTATHSLIQLNLIDGYWVFVNPIFLGRGIPLFADINPDSYRDKIKLNLVTTQQFTCGVTELNYTVDRQ
jgi:dihydrofolate reductase